MKKILYATGNKYKIESMKKRLEGMDIDNLIASKINPSEDERKLGAEPVNVFDPFKSPLMILRCCKGSVGRDFSKSSWAPEKQSHGNLVPDKRDDKGNILSYRPLTEADKADQAKAREYLVWLMDQLKQDEISLKEQWMYKEPDEKTLEQVRKSLELIETGSYNSEPAGDSNKMETEVKQEEKVANEFPTQSLEFLFQGFFLCSYAQFA